MCRHSAGALGCGSGGGAPFFSGLRLGDSFGFLRIRATGGSGFQGVGRLGPGEGFEVFGFAGGLSF